MFPRALARVVPTAARVAPRRIACAVQVVARGQRSLSTARPRVVAVSRVPLPKQQQQQQRQKQQQQRQQSSHKKGGRWMTVGVLAGATLATALTNEAMADEKVNWNAVRADIQDLLDSDIDYDDGSFGPVIVRLAWHSSGSYSKHDGSGGSNGATMRFHPEANYGANAGLGVARDKLEAIKRKHPNISYADLYTFAGAIAIEHMGGPAIPWQPGRTDARSGDACAGDGRLPAGDGDAKHIREIFYRMGFSDQEIVALAGAHALGRCHSNRSGFDGPWTRSPTTFSNSYFKLLLEEDWRKRNWSGPLQYENHGAKDLMMLEPDMQMIKDPRFRKYAEQYAKDEDLFFRDFAKAFGKLLELGVPRHHSVGERGIGWVQTLFGWRPGRPVRDQFFPPPEQVLPPGGGPM